MPAPDVERHDQSPGDRVPVVGPRREKSGVGQKVRERGQVDLDREHRAAGSLAGAQSSHLLTPDDTTPRCDQKNARIDVTCFAHSRPHSTAVRGRSGAPVRTLTPSMPGERCRHVPILAAKTPHPPQPRTMAAGVVALKNCNRAGLYSHPGNDMTRHAVAAGSRGA